MSTPTSPPEFVEAVLDAVSPSRLASRLEAAASELVNVACVQSQAPDFDPAAALQDMASKTARLLHHTARFASIGAGVMPTASLRSRIPRSISSSAPSIGRVRDLH